MTGAVVVLGEVMVELREEPGGLLRRGVGGDTFNVAYHLARSGVPVRYVSALGDDELSDGILDVARGVGIDVSLVERVTGGLPGLYLVRVDASGQRRFHYWRSASPARRLLDRPLDALAEAALDGAAAVVVSGITAAILGADGRRRLWTLLDRARAAGVIVVVDPNHRVALWPDRETAADAIRQALARADVALASTEDVSALFGEASGADAAARRLAALGPAEVAVTDGAAATALLADGAVTLVLVPPVEALDTTGAGDAFDAGYLRTRLGGGTPHQAVAAGHALAASVVVVPGALAV